MTAPSDVTTIAPTVEPIMSRPGATRVQRDSLLKWSFVAPTLIFLIALNVFPLCYNLILSFTNASLLNRGSSYVGGKNYAIVFSNPIYSQALRTTGMFVLLAVTVELILGFVLALSLKRDFRGKTIVLTILLIPMMLSPAVMGLYWNLILSGSYGVLNQVLDAMHLGQPQWTTDPSLKLIALVMVDVWMWTPFMMLIALAGLNSIPNYIYEAAEIDRASRWTVFRRITLPMCLPLLLLAVLFRTTDALKQFDLVMAITGANDPATQTLSAMLYQVSMRNGYLGLGAAFSIIVLVIVIALASVFVRYLDSLAKRQGKAA
jgi:multiple sugar transport system permease protein